MDQITNIPAQTEKWRADALQTEYSHCTPPRADQTNHLIFTILKSLYWYENIMYYTGVPERRLQNLNS